MTIPAERKREILDAINGIKAAGEKPTYETIRDKLGGGSYATIAPVFREWKAGQEAESGVLTEPLPQKLVAALETAGMAIWQAAVQAAEARLQEERTSLALARVALEDESNDLTGTADRLERELAEAREACKQLQTRLNSESAKGGELKAQCDALRGAAAERDQWRARAEDAMRELEALKAQGAVLERLKEIIRK